ncbi:MULTISPECIES: hypothetical protein [unclassified Pseudomonas]|uniref:hypothetical protein n=1 Tax=unclassified Pseudomonas TaxID=196821 RepID=UPI001CC090AE|nr:MULTISPECIES: hypothetical protein [unclassified Pseudomonas]
MTIDWLNSLGVTGVSGEGERSRAANEQAKTPETEKVSGVFFLLFELVGGNHRLAAVLPIGQVLIGEHWVWLS